MPERTAKTSRAPDTSRPSPGNPLNSPPVPRRPRRTCGGLGASSADQRSDARLDVASRPPHPERMNVTMQIPDDIAQRLTSTGGDLSRRALEALALEEFKAGRLAKAELRRMLGFSTRQALDGFLKAHAVFDDYTLDDLDEDRRDLDRLGL